MTIADFDPDFIPQEPGAIRDGSRREEYPVSFEGRPPPQGRHDVSRGNPLDGLDAGGRRIMLGLGSRHHRTEAGGRGAQRRAAAVADHARHARAGSKTRRLRNPRRPGPAIGRGAVQIPIDRAAARPRSRRRAGVVRRGAPPAARRDGRGPPADQRFAAADPRRVGRRRRPRLSRSPNSANAAARRSSSSIPTNSTGLPRRWKARSSASCRNV